MQISRHWRMNAQRYQLQGVRYENGDVGLHESTTRYPDPENPPPNPETETLETLMARVYLEEAAERQGGGEKIVPVFLSKER